MDNIQDYDSYTHGWDYNIKMDLREN
jgi:hypothetical protein